METFLEASRFLWGVSVEQNRRGGYTHSPLLCTQVTSNNVIDATLIIRTAMQLRRFSHSSSLDHLCDNSQTCPLKSGTRQENGHFNFEEH